MLVFVLNRSGVGRITPIPSPSKSPTHPPLHFSSKHCMAGRRGSVLLLQGFHKGIVRVIEGVGGSVQLKLVDYGCWRP